MSASSLPVSKTDKKMSKDHLKRTMKVQKEQAKLVEDKIDDHAKAIKKARKDRNKRSIKYNAEHMSGHMEELKTLRKMQKRSEKQMKKVKAMK